MMQDQETPTTSDNQVATRASGRRWNRIDFVLLILCSVLIAGRCMIFESFPRSRRLGTPPANIDIGVAEVTAMTVFASLIVTLAFLWILFRLTAPTIAWRKTSLTVPLFLLALGSGISYMAASNKHAACIEIWNLLSITILGVLLIQLLNAPWKRRFLLCVLAATGVVMAHRCWEQNSHELTEVEKAFLEDPNQALQAQGIVPGTYGAYQYANRVRSRDIRGYFGVSNSTAAFFILSIMATAALLLERIQKKNLNQDWQFLLAGVLLLLIQIVALWLTQSKGGIVSFLAASGFFAIFWFFRKPFQRHWRNVMIVCVVLTIGAVVAVAAHGMVHDRLPTNSMWVRWQYWKASADMIADHWFTGVGPQNFGTHYLQYMDPAAPEEVKDPHCLPISLWSQWGIFGVMAFVWAVIAIAIRLARPFAKIQTENDVDPRPEPSIPNEPKKLWVYGILISVGIMSLRLAVSDLSGCESAAERNSVLLLSFMIPSAIWLAAFVVLLALTRTTGSAANYSLDMVNSHSGLVSLILGCGLLGFLLHNCIDFGFFRPGVAGICFVCIAVAIASRSNQPPDVCIGNHLKFILIALLIGAAAVYHLWMNMTLPVARSQRYMDQALTHPAQALAWLEKATQQNPLDPEPHSLTCEILILDRKEKKKIDLDTLEKAISALQQAIQRNPAQYGFHDQLSKIYLSYFRLKPEFAKLALDSAQQALARNPNDSKLLIYYAELLTFLAPATGQDHAYEQAAQALQKALDNEKAFSEQQKEMYPEHKEPIYRLEPQKIKQAQTLQKLLQTDRTN